MSTRVIERDARELLLPPEVAPLFDARFVRSNKLIEEYVARSALEVARAIGLVDAASQQVGSVDDVLVRAGLSPDLARVPIAWLCETFARRGWLERAGAVDDVARFHLPRALPRLEPQEVLEWQQVHDARALPSFRIVALAVEAYPAVLRGEMTGEEALFSRRNIAAWYEYFSNANPLYAVNNALHALALRRCLRPDHNAVLEIGAGLGSASEAFLESLDKDSTALSNYHVTDISPQFLRRSKATLGGRFPAVPLSFGWLDIDQPLLPQGVHPGTYSLVHGVNVLHVARDLGKSLAELRTALQDGGTLVVTECVRPYPDEPLYVDFVFNLLASFRAPPTLAPWRPRGGFLTPEQWTAALAANGFGDIGVFPDIARIRDALPSFVIASITARRT
ncbi:MAG: class I SAM-dependent methyltransferase [Casimicrobiaceae bacterium]